MLVLCSSTMVGRRRDSSGHGGMSNTPQGVKTGCCVLSCQHWQLAPHKQFRQNQRQGILQMLFHCWTLEATEQVKHFFHPWHIPRWSVLKFRTSVGLCAYSHFAPRWFAGHCSHYFSWQIVQHKHGQLFLQDTCTRIGIAVPSFMSTQQKPLLFLLGVFLTVFHKFYHLKTCSSQMIPILNHRRRGPRQL